MDSPPAPPVLPETCDFTVFGGTGDLALRKLLPALYHRDLEGQLPADTRILGVSRSDLDDAGWRDEGAPRSRRLSPPSTCRPPRSTASWAGCTI